MNCPSCDHTQSRVIETIRVRDGLRRHRICSKCRHKFSTLEQVALWDPTLSSYVAAVDDPPPLAVVPDPRPAEQPAAARKRPNNRRWYPIGVPAGVCEEAAPLLLEWWNDSRGSKHGGNAVWSERAWLASVERVKALPDWKQLLLCKAGVEHGWQALRPEYLKEELARPAAGGRPMPKDPAMLAALDSWPKQA